MNLALAALAALLAPTSPAPDLGLTILPLRLVQLKKVSLRLNMMCTAMRL